MERRRNNGDIESIKMIGDYIHTYAMGEVADYRELQDTVTMVDNKITYNIIVDACVIKDTTRPDPDFKLNMSIIRNDGLLVNSQVAAFYHGDEFQLGFQPSKDCYLTIFHIDLDTINLLFPNSVYSSNYISRDSIFIIPEDPELLSLVAENNTENEIIFESLLAIGTIWNKPFCNLDSEIEIKEDSTLVTTKGMLYELYNWRSNFRRKEVAKDQRRIEIFR
jgi:hypothetical protein